MRKHLAQALLVATPLFAPLLWTACSGGGEDAPSCTATAEECNGRDDDCDGETDEAGALGCTAYLRDADGDGAGLSGDVRCLCSAAAPYTASAGGDCDDASAALHPGAEETCNGLDDDCDAETDEALAGCCAPAAEQPCGVAMGVCTEGVSTCSSAFAWGPCLGDGGEPVTSPGAELESCNGLDDDCDGETDEGNPGGGGSCSSGLPGICSGGAVACVAGALQCVSSVAPGATAEACNFIDDDCDGATDEAPALGCTSFYLDADGDGFGVAGQARCQCAPAPPFVASIPGDCGDTNPMVHPGAAEVCDNSIDDDCDAMTDEGCL